MILETSVSIQRLFAIRLVLDGGYAGWGFEESASGATTYISFSPQTPSNFYFCALE